MTLSERIAAMVQLGEYIKSGDGYLQAVMQRSYLHNPWFTVENQQLALDMIANYFLRQDLLEQWLNGYEIATATPLNVGLVMADRIPLAGFHDLLAIFLTGNHASIKLAEKDIYLLPHLIKILQKINPATESYFSITPKLKDFQAIITAGYHKSNRYFEQYFSQYPSLIRKDKKGVAILNGTETAAELTALGKDVFSYFGLSHRSVSKLYVPTDYQFEPLLEALHEYRQIVLHNKYKSNFDYHFAIYTLNRAEYLANGCIMLRKSETIHSPMANLHYEFYEDTDQLNHQLQTKKEEIELTVSKNIHESLPSIGFGQTPYHALWDYPDDKDTIAFLLSVE